MLIFCYFIFKIFFRIDWFWFNINSTIYPWSFISSRLIFSRSMVKRLWEWWLQWKRHCSKWVYSGACLFCASIRRIALEITLMGISCCCFDMHRVIRQWTSIRETNASGHMVEFGVQWSVCIGTLVCARYNKKKLIHREMWYKCGESCLPIYVIENVMQGLLGETRNMIR